MIQAVFYAKRPADLYNEYAVAATNRRLLLLMLNYFGRVTGMAGEAPRQTRLGPCSGILRAIPSLSAGKTPAIGAQHHPHARRDRQVMEPLPVPLRGPELVSTHRLSPSRQGRRGTR